MKKGRVLLIAALLVITLTAGLFAAPARDAGPNAKKLRVAVCLMGMLGDLSYNDLLKQGTDRAVNDFGVEVKFLEAKGPADYESNLIAAIAGGFDLVICQGSAYISMLAQHAAENPKRLFAITDAIMSPIPPNVTCAAFAPNEGQFLVGATMAMLATRTNIPGITGEKKVGWITGIESPNINDFWAGFEQGVKYIDPSIQILKAFVGSWSDPIKAKELALAQYDQGVSVIANVGSRSGLGIFEAAKERGRYVIGVDMNQDNLAPGNVVTSMLKHIDVGVYTVIESLVKNKFRGGEYMYMDLKANGIGLTDFSVFKKHLGNNFPQDIYNKVQELNKKIISGEIVVNTFPGIRPWEKK